MFSQCFRFWVSNFCSIKLSFVYSNEKPKICPTHWYNRERHAAQYDNLYNYVLRITLLWSKCHFYSRWSQTLKCLCLHMLHFWIGPRWREKKLQKRRFYNKGYYYMVYFYHHLWEMVFFKATLKSSRGLYLFQLFLVPLQPLSLSWPSREWVFGKVCVA